MGNDLVSACVFCAGLLLGVEMPPPAGYHVEVGVAEDTEARLYTIDSAAGRQDVSHVTTKGGFVGLGRALPSGGGMGAGTPQAEWRLRFALGPSHNEQIETPSSSSNTRATGSGRYDNFAVVVRYPLSARDSLEAASSRHSETATDSLNIGRENFVLSEEREISAERLDFALGWRRRWNGFEAALSGRYARPSASESTAANSREARGPLYGAALELRARRGRWTLAGSAERVSGSIGVHEKTQPAFRSRDFDATATQETYRLGVGYSSRKTDVFFDATSDQMRLPFVVIGVLGTEVPAFDTGYRPESRSRVWFWDLTARHSLAPRFRVKALIRFSKGDETVTLTDPAGVLPTRQLSVQRTGIFGKDIPYGPLVSLGLQTIGLGAEITLP